MSEPKRRRRATPDHHMREAVNALLALFDRRLREIDQAYAQRERQMQEQLTGALEIVAQAVVEHRLGHVSGDASMQRVSYRDRPLTRDQGQRLTCPLRRRR